MGLRGGTFESRADVVRVTFRNNDLPTNTGYAVGFRLARTLPPATLSPSPLPPKGSKIKWLFSVLLFTAVGCDGSPSGTAGTGCHRQDLRLHRVDLPTHHEVPRNHRFALGERIERNLYALLETLLRA